MTIFVTSCRKCGKPRKESIDDATIEACGASKYIMLGYRCDCGHWNDLKRRKKGPK